MRPTPRLVAVAVSLAAAAVSAAAQARPSRDSARGISSWVASIEHKRAALTTVVLDLPSSSSEGSQVALLRDGDAVRKVTAIYYGESGKATECYYVLDDRPRYFVRTQWRYTEPLSGKVRSQTTERVWLNGDAVIRWQDSRGRITHAPSALKQKGEEVRRGFAALIGTTHEGFKSQERMPNVRCS